MRVLAACAAGAFLALCSPIGSAAADTVPSAAVPPGRSGLVQADWDGRPNWNDHRYDHWHHHWRHEWRPEWHPDWHPDWHPEWHPEWHHHRHHGWDRPYGYQY